MVVVSFDKTITLEKTLSYVASSTGLNLEPSSTTSPVVMYQYIEVLDGCNPYFVGDCVNMRSGPGTEFPIVVHLRTGVVLKVGDVVTNKNGEVWYKILFSHELLYPERVKGDWYVNAQFVHLFSDDGDHLLKKNEVITTTKRIVVDVSEEKLYAYDGDVLFMEESISTGLEFTPTPRGTFLVFKMTPSRFMQGPIPGVSDQVYDLPGVPWNLYFTKDGAVIHGAYWHDHFGKPWSHGCVNLPPQKAKELYLWADIGTPVIVQN
jgi:lipoprotein-anchoring transpeptidase ErfK/SrfK